ncbi:inositol monophosphatase 2-like [Scaptodrosophila lebanonensis]|uniref:Inositol monophosphatase 2-like n=1 Tax=Drosophila lebanonensis TaxID=7225 RepID=A0A6J2UJG6_DROLE|nr:inositol monophosphatase 2-like [Scaptodrosophila lebanonensis]
MTYNYTEKELKTYYDVALEQVNKCGQIFMEGYRKSKLDAKVKDAYWDFVTVYDVQIEQTLCQSLKAAFPESIFIGEEETSSTKNKMKLTDAPTWILDPIDGTTNFMHKLPFSAISLALTINKQLVMGVVYNPAANELYSAWKANGAYLNGQRIHVSGARKVCNTK